MSQERAAYRVNADRPPLAGVFERVLQRVCCAPSGLPGRVMAEFAASLADGAVFNLAQIEGLPEESDRALCLELLDYCMSTGLTEDERRAASDAFGPFVEIYEPGTRH